MAVYVYEIMITGKEGTFTIRCDNKETQSIIWDWCYQRGYKVELAGPYYLRKTAHYAMDEVVRQCGVPY